MTALVGGAQQPLLIRTNYCNLEVVQSPRCLNSWQASRLFQPFQPSSGILNEWSTRKKEDTPSSMSVPSSLIDSAVWMLVQAYLSPGGVTYPCLPPASVLEAKLGGRRLVLCGRLPCLRPAQDIPVSLSRISPAASHSLPSLVPHHA